MEAKKGAVGTSDLACESEVLVTTWTWNWHLNYWRERNGFVGLRPEAVESDTISRLKCRNWIKLQDTQLVSKNCLAVWENWTPRWNWVQNAFYLSLWNSHKLCSGKMGENGWGDSMVWMKLFHPAFCLELFIPTLSDYSEERKLFFNIIIMRRHFISFP